ncbi:hypothetical protein G7046_g4170 [Stylonectria norvegica]|nr:hypothetical protein G7046_g4170 [Stylonectria norvegica]
MSRPQPMSIEAMLAQENEAVLELLNGNQSPETARATSPMTRSPRSPIRSMLDIGPPAPGSPRQAPVRSMLDINGPSPPPSVRSLLTNTDIPALGSSTTPNSPTSPIDLLPRRPAGPSYPAHVRSFSDASQNPVDFGPRSSRGGRTSDHTAQYQFSNFMPNATNAQQQPKRNTQGGKKKSGNALSDALLGTGLQQNRDRGRHQSLGSGRLSHTSMSPDTRMTSRSRSPALRGNRLTLDDGSSVDMANAYRRLTDANLARSGGPLADLTKRADAGMEGQGRLIKDYLGPNGEVLGSSDEEEPYSSDDEDRGRKKAPRSLNPDARGEVRFDEAGAPIKPTRKSMSLLGAAEEERMEVASKQPPKYVYRSLLSEPEIKVTAPSGGTGKNPQKAVHPNTSYDVGPTGSLAASQLDSDEEATMDDIKRAQQLSFSMTPIIASPEAHRAIRIIYRGEYTKIAEKAHEENRRLRKYLVATDLSEESTHALEWGIGTVLRDGDTLIAIYCVDEETGIIASEGGSVPDDPKAMKEQAAAINSVANNKSTPAPMTAVPEFMRSSPFHLRGDSKSSTPTTSPAPSSRQERTKADEERRRAVKDITDRVLKLLRKTPLQVRVIVEVLHCKNPKHLITEVIDLINPTLVVIGSRGRSALKGVILGSFSNYLVTKSSVPVMVARKRLRKTSKFKAKDVPQVNNLSNPTAKSLAQAKID